MFASGQGEVNGGFTCIKGVQGLWRPGKCVSDRDLC